MLHLSIFKKIPLVMFGLFIGLVLLEIGLRLAGFMFFSLQENRNSRYKGGKNTYRIMCLGESTTVLPLGDGAYPNQLEKILNEQQIGIKFVIINKGVPAVDSAYLLAHLEENLNRYSPDMVIAMMGINDKSSPVFHKNSYVLKIEALVKNLKIYKLMELLKLHIADKIKLQKQANRKLRIDNSINSYQEYIELGESYVGLKDYAQAEKMFREAIKLRGIDKQAYFMLFALYRSMGEFEMAETLMKKLLELDYNNSDAYINLGLSYDDQGKVLNAEAAFKTAIKLDSKSQKAYRALAWHYRNQNNYQKAETVFKKIIEMDHYSEQGYLELGWCCESAGEYYKNMNKYTEAERMFKKAIELNPSNDKAYGGLGRCYVKLNRLSEAEGMFKQVINIDPMDLRAYGELAHLYDKQNKVKLSEHYFQIADNLRTVNYNLETRNNYKKLEEIVKKNKIIFVCAQYPMRNVSSLKMLLDNNDDVIFVDNEKVFKNAITKYKSQMLFSDMFAGDFGHCTPKGNKLLAANLARVILERCFGKELK